MKRGTLIKDLFENKKYVDVIEALQNICSGLFELDNVSSIETYTYLDIINSYLSTYEYLKNNYQKY